MSKDGSRTVRGPVKLPYWSHDPFAHLSKDQKNEIKYAEREVDDRMKSIHPNGTFLLNIPPPLPGRMIEPESMTVRKKGRKYMDPHPVKMKTPRLYRGRGRTWRLEAERKG